MKSAFRLNQHPRRAQPLLSAPPAGYFEQLPRRVMDRLPPPDAETSPAAGWRWLLALPPVWRTSLASGALLAGFAGSFWLSSSGPTGPAGSPAALASLDAVPRTELVGYLLTSEANVQATDIAELLATPSNLSDGILRASETEIRDALDAQPSEESFLL